jgi:hypothetical protein
VIHPPGSDERHDLGHSNQPLRVLVGSGVRERIMPPSVPGPSAVRARSQEMLAAFGRVSFARLLS